jgi:hypothetical protein
VQKDVKEMLLNAGLPADLFKSELNGELCGLLNT